MSNNLSIAETATVPRRPYTPRNGLIFGVWLAAGLTAAVTVLLLTTKRRVATATALAA